MEAALGAVKEIEITTTEKCSECKGKAALENILVMIVMVVVLLLAHKIQYLVVF